MAGSTCSSSRLRTFWEHGWEVAMATFCFGVVELVPAWDTSLEVDYLGKQWAEANVMEQRALKKMVESIRKTVKSCKYSAASWHCLSALIQWEVGRWISQDWLDISECSGTIHEESVSSGFGHTFNPSTWEAEAGEFLSLRSAWPTEWVPRNPVSEKKEREREKYIYSYTWWPCLDFQLRRQKQVDLWVHDQPGLHSEFQDSQSYIVRPCLKKGVGSGGKGWRDGLVHKDLLHSLINLSSVSKWEGGSHQHFQHLRGETQRIRSWKSSSIIWSSRQTWATRDKQ